MDLSQLSAQVHELSKGTLTGVGQEAADLAVWPAKLWGLVRFQIKMALLTDEN